MNLDIPSSERMNTGTIGEGCSNHVVVIVKDKMILPLNCSRRFLTPENIHTLSHDITDPGHEIHLARLGDVIRNHSGDFFGLFAFSVLW
jgi:hypothetical protein